MLYCDLSISDVVIWTGVPCLTGVNIKSSSYLNFIGALIFVDTVGNLDPTYTELVDRFILLYITDGQPNIQVPLQAIPAQQLNIILSSQNCVLSFYEKDTSALSAL